MEYSITDKLYEVTGQVPPLFVYSVPVVQQNIPDNASESQGKTQLDVITHST